MVDQGFLQKKSLIVCYSYSGNTLHVAEEIKRQTGATLCEIYPKQPYSMIFESVVEQAKKEITNGTLPSLFPITEHIEDYHTIYVGTPNWCGTVAPPIAAFLKGNNLEGRLLLPFYTHCDTGGGDVEQDIRNMCPDVTVGEGISILNDGGSNLSEIIAQWLNRRKYEE